MKKTDLDLKDEKLEFNNVADQAAASFKRAISKEEYKLLLELQDVDLIENKEVFECPICICEINPGEGIILHDCLHQFCKECMAQVIKMCENVELICPYRDNDSDYLCNMPLQHREIKLLVTPEEYEVFLEKSAALAEHTNDKTVHCKTPDCKYWCVIEGKVDSFTCQFCLEVNCFKCQAIHTGQNCAQYQDTLKTEESIQMFNEMIAKGEALICPSCAVVVTKELGCDWMQCTMCKTEICWATRGPRWGPRGKGDATGGCRCGQNSVKCHPQCNNCH